MRCFWIAPSVAVCLCVSSLLGTPTASAADRTNNQSASKAAAQTSDSPAERYATLPLSFESNQGQSDGQVRFLSRGSGYSFFLTHDGALLTFAHDAHSDAAVFRMRLAGANPEAQIHGVDELPGKTNYFFGNDAQRWRTSVPTYSKVAYEDIYPGINLVYYGNQRQLEYDFVLAPGADPKLIQLAVSGAEQISVDGQGNLVLHGVSGEVQLLAPNVYQQIQGRKHQVAGQWVLTANNTAGFHIGDYDRAKPLVIDPVLQYSSFLGGSQKNALTKVAVDAAGNAYVAGYTALGDFPAAPTPQATTFGNGTPSRGAFVAKIDATGSTLLYSTYLSGSVGEEATGLAIDATGNVYVAGTTHSPDFPTHNALQTSCATHTQAGTCSSAFLTKISPSGDMLLFSTYLGGSGGELARGLAIDATGSAYMVGVTSSPDFPATSGAAQAKCAGSCQQNAFVAKFSPTGDKLTYATYLGGSGVDDSAAIAVDGSGGAYVTGHTTSPDFPAVSAYQKSCAPDSLSSSGACVATAFLTKLKADGSALVYSTYLGGMLGSQATDIAVDAQGSAYLTGSTLSSDFPVVKAYQKSCAKDAVSGLCSLDAFVTKFAPSGKTLVYSTYLGGSGRDEATGIALDATGNAHIVGRTESANFPSVAAAQKQLSGQSDAFVARLNAAGSALSFSTYHGGSALESGNGIALDLQGSVYVTGETSSPDFPTLHPFQSSCAGTCANAFVSKMALPPPGVTASTTTLTNTPSTSTFGQTVTLGATVTGGSGTPTGTVDFKDGATLLGTQTLDGTGAASMTVSTLSAGSHSLTAVYSGDATYASSTSAVAPQTVNPASTTTAMTAVPATSSTFGQSVTFTATVAAVPPGAGTPVGTVDFSQGGTSLTGCATVTVNGSGVATCTTSALNVGSYTIKGTYNPVGGNFNTSNGTVAYTVNAAATTTTVTAVPGSSTHGESVTFTAAVAAVAPGAGIPIGTVAFDQNGAAITGCTSVAVDSSGNATCTTTTLPVGSDTIKGTYTSTSTNFTGSNGSLAYTVSGAATTTTVTAVPASSTFGQSVTFTATVAVVPPGTGTPDGTVDFAENGTAIAGCTGVALNGSGVATCTTTALPAGSDSIKGTYTPTSTNFMTSNGTLVYTVTAASTTTTVTAVPASSTFGQSVTFTATVAVVAPGVGTPVGSVDFTQNGTAIAGCTGAALNGSGVATCTTTTLPAGSDAVKGTYNPTGGNFITSNGTLTYTVSPAATTTTITAVPASSTYGQSVTFTATVAVVPPGVGTPVGSVDFTQNGTAIAGCTGVTLNGSGVATCTTTTLPAGADAVKGTYNPTGGSFITSNGTLAYTVTAASTTTTVSAVPVSTSPLGQSVTFTAAVAPVAPGGGTPVGTVDFTQNGSTITGCTGVAVNGSGNATCTTSSLPAGTDTIKATYTPTGTNYLGSNGTLTYTVVAPPVIAKAFSPTPITLGATSALTFTITNPSANTVAEAGVAFTDTLPANLTVASGTATVCGGTLTTTNPTGISLSGASIAVSGQCQFAVTVTGATGGLNITNTTGNVSSTNGGTGNTATATITVQDYTFSAVDNTAVFVQGAGPTVAAATATVTPNFTYAGTVSPVGCAPPGFTCTFANTTSGTVQVSIGAAANTPVGPYPVITLSATDNSTPPIVHSASPFSLFVECSYSLGNTGTASTVPTYTPSITGGPYALFVMEVAGGSNCPWGPSANAPGPGPALGTAGVNIATGSTGTLTAAGTGSPVTFAIPTPIAATATVAQVDTITVNYFQVGPTDPQNVGSSTFNVVQEAPVAATVNAGVTSSATLAITASPANPNNQSGDTLTFALVAGLNGAATPTVCSVTALQTDGTYALDPSGLNYGVSCAQPAPVALAGTQGSFSLQISIPAGLKAANERSERGKPIFFYAFLLGLPAIVFVGAGTVACGPKRKRLAQGITSVAGVILILALMALLPSCAGGFNANFGGNKASSYLVTVMGYVSDGGNNIQGEEIFTVPLTIVK